MAENAPDSHMAWRKAHFDVGKLRVLLDMDGVLADFEGHFLTRWREVHPQEPFIPLEKREGVWIRDQYAKINKDLPDKVREIYNQEGFFLNIPAIEGACAAAKEMAEIEDVDVFICSSPLDFHKYCLTEKMAWVERHLGKEWTERMILCKDKTLVNAHVLIDDRPSIKGVMSKPAWEHVVFTCCHNTTADLKGRQRLENWTDGSWRDLIEDFKKRV